MLRKALWVFLRPLIQLVTNILSPEVGEEWLKELNKFLRKESCWIKPAFGKLEVITVVDPWKPVSIHVFVERAQKLVQNSHKRLLGDDAFLFYSKPENWHLLPAANSGVNLIVFANIPKHQYCRHYQLGLPFLGRNGEKWEMCVNWTEQFHDSYVIAVL